MSEVPSTNSQSVPAATAANGDHSAGPNLINWYALFFSVLVLAFLFRAFGLTDQCLTNDEVIEVEDAMYSTWSEVFWCPDAFPPAYRLLLGAWENVFGVGTTTRWLSLILGMVFLQAIMFCTWLITESKPSTLWAGFIAGVNPLMIHYSQETRAYMMYLCVAAWILVFFIRSVKFNRRSDWILLAIFSAGGCYTHYYTGLWLICLAIIWFVCVVRRRELLSGGLLAFVIACFSLIPLLSFFIPDFYDTVGYPVKLPASAVAIGYTYFSFMAGFCIGPSRAELHELEAVGLVKFFIPWLAVIGILVLYSLYHAIKPLLRRQTWFWTMLLCATLPVMIAAGLSLMTDLRFGVRYVVICVIPVLCVLGVGVANIPSRTVRWAIAAGFLSIAIIATYARHYVPRYKNEDLRSVAQELSLHKSGTVFILADYNKRPLGHYVGHQEGFVPLPVPEKTAEQIDDETELAEVLARMDQADQTRPIWIVLCRAFHGDPHHLFRNWLSESACVDMAAEYDGVKLFRYKANVTR